jgi:hypothetical protein
MRKNTGNSSVKRRRRREDPMQEFDRLPPDLRVWLSTAMLPWRARSVRRAYDKAHAATGCPHRAIEALDRLERRRIAQDAARVWGKDHPVAQSARL